MARKLSLIATVLGYVLSITNNVPTEDAKKSTLRDFEYVQDENPTTTNNLYSKEENELSRLFYKYWAVTKEHVDEIGQNFVSICRCDVSLDRCSDKMDNTYTPKYNYRNYPGYRQVYPSYISSASHYSNLDYAYESKPSPSYNYRNFPSYSASYNPSPSYNYPTKSSISRPYLVYSYDVNSGSSYSTQFNSYNENNQYSSSCSSKREGVKMKLETQYYFVAKRPGQTEPDTNHCQCRNIPINSVL